MEILISVIVVAAVAFVGYKILQKQRENNNAKYQADDGPISQEQIKSIVDAALKPVETKTESSVPATPFTGFPKSPESAESTPKSESRKNSRAKSTQKGEKTTKPKSGAPKTKKTKKTA